MVALSGGRAIADLVAPVEVTGQVLAVTPVGTFGDADLYKEMSTSRFVGWTRRRYGGPRLTPEGGIVGIYYVVIDDGQSDITQPWVGVPKLADMCEVGTVVRLTGRPWSRRGIAVSVSVGGRSNRAGTRTYDCRSDPCC